MKNLDVNEIIKKIETKYNVEKIMYGDIPIWPFIRIKLFSMWFDNASGAEKQLFSDTKKKESKLKNYKFLLKLLFRSYFPYFLKKNQMLFFVNDPCFRKTEDTIEDRIGGEILKSYDDIIPIVPNYIKDVEYPFKHYLSIIVINYMSKLLFKKFDKEKIKGTDIFFEIENELGLKIDLIAFVEQINRYILFYNKWFRLIKPKKIIVECYYAYDRMAAFFAAKKASIPVIELQHGLIGLSHIAYNSYKEIYPNPYPNYLFCFGEKFIDYVSPCIYKRNNIRITGNYYLEYIKNNREKISCVFKEKYRNITGKIITVISQNTIDKKYLSFYKEFAEKNPEYFIIFVPRYREDYHNCLLPNNMSIEFELDVYQCMINSDITSTVYSTCCLESLALGKPCLLIDINGLAKSMLQEFLTVDTTMKVCPENDDPLRYIGGLLSVERQLIISEGEKYYKTNHKELLIENINSI